MLTNLIIRYHLFRDCEKFAEGLFTALVDSEYLVSKAR